MPRTSKIPCSNGSQNAARHARFRLGRLTATANAMSTLAEVADPSLPGDDARRAIAAERLAAHYLARHAVGDWGDVSPEDLKANALALVEGDRLFSSYDLPGGGRIWVITEWDRSATRLLLPEDY